MSDSFWLETTVFSFLLTYLIHSTVIIGAIALLVHRIKRFRQPTVQVLSWKLAIVLPLLTASVMTLFPFPHFGFRFALSESLGRNVVGEGVVPAFEFSRQTEIRPATTVSVPTKDVNHQTEVPLVSDHTADEIAPRAHALFTWQTFSLWIAGIWTVAVLIGMVRLCFQTRRLRSLRVKSTPVRDPILQGYLNRLAQKMQISQHIGLLESPEVSGAFAAGIWRPFIVIQARGDGDSNHSERGRESEALLAHELAHIAHRDATWNLLVQIVQRLFPFQPLLRTVGRRLQIAMDFAADESAAKVLGEHQGLVQCLIRLGDQMFNRQTLLLKQSGLVAGMVAFRSTLGQRVERLLTRNHIGTEPAPVTRFAVVTCLTMLAMAVAGLVPQAVAEKQTDSSASHTSSRQENTMKSTLSTLAVLIGLTAPVGAEEPQDSQPVQRTKELRATPDKLPEGIKRFNGMLVGRLAAKDVEKGSFVVVVDAVPRVWRNSKAENPKSIVGKSIQIEGVFGKFLDVLVTTRAGETIEFECKHDGGALVFPGELLRKVAPYKAEDYPVLPEDFRGFRGAVVAEIKKKDPETFELIVDVKKVLDVWKENGAKQPESIVGKQMMLAGFWNRKEAYHKLKVGGRIEVGMQHIGRQSDHLTVAEFVRQSDRVAATTMRRENPVGEGGENPIRGFRGMLVGRLVKKDVERGTFTVTVDAVPRVWKNNQSRAPKSLIGQNVDADRVPQRLLDALVVTRIGETIQFGALHDGGDNLRVGEVLRKVAPVKKGDYPELPDDFRGFRGILHAKVVKKDQQLWELTVEVADVVKEFENDRSRNAESVVGKRVMLSGFWNRKDAYHSISVGDKIQVGVEHPQRLGDQLSVIEGVRKLDD